MSEELEKRVAELEDRVASLERAIVALMGASAPMSKEDQQRTADMLEGAMDMWFGGRK